MWYTSRLMKIHSYETFGAADGPGVRFIVFLSGCPFRCAYCHNPDTWARPPAFEAAADEVLARALRYKSYWGEQGGITVSGGEPLMQAAEVAELFQKAHRAGVTTCLDTAGACFRRGDVAQEELFRETDTVLLDIKLFDDERHRALTGSSNAPVLDCARYLSETGVDIWIRRVIVPGLTDDEDDLRKTGDFIHSLKTVKRVDFLPYHTLGVPKWEALGLPYRLKDTREATSDDIARARHAFELG